jgi:hypothetical protein
MKRIILSADEDLIERARAIARAQDRTLKRFSNRYTPKPLQPSGFFPKKKPPCTELNSARELENRSDME